MNTVTVIGIGSIALGAVCVWLAFWAFMTKRPTGLVVGLGIGAFLLLTLVPVTLAVGFAARMPS